MKFRWSQCIIEQDYLFILEAKIVLGGSMAEHGWKLTLVFFLHFLTHLNFIFNIVTISYRETDIVYRIVSCVYRPTSIDDMCSATVNWN